MTLFAAIAKTLAQAPQRRCLTTRNDEPWLARDLLKQTEHIAGALAGLGIGAGQRVLVKYPKSPDLVLLYLATLRLGAVFVPISPDQTEPETDYILTDVKPHLLICHDHESAAFQKRQSLVKVISMARLRNSPPAPLPSQQATAEAPAAILYTSGTTGRPKGAVLRHDNLLQNAKVLLSAWQISNQDRLLHVLPMHHTHGLFVALNPLLLAGAEIVLRDQFSARKTLEDLARCTLFMGVPTHYARLLQQPELAHTELTQIRLFISGSAPLPKALSDAFFAKTGQRILERYGMTETGMLTSNPLNGKRKAGTVGRPLEGVGIRIRAASNTRIGEVEVKGRNVFSGYWRKPQATREAFTEDGYFKTGDLGYFDSEGYLHLLARRSDLIISGGLNIYPAEVEEAISSLEGVEEVAVIGVPHPDFGEAVVAVVAGNIVAPALATIKAHLSGKLSSYKHPKHVVKLNALPRNRMGKVEKHRLRQQFANLLTTNPIKF